MCFVVFRLTGHITKPRPLLGQSNLFSFDLKAAIDSYPVDFSGGVLFSLFGRRLAESWILILCAFFFLLSVTRKGTFAQIYVFWFTMGQPLGFYSSWPVFTHASYAGVVCNMEGTPWGEILWLCSTGRWNCHRGPCSREVISWGYGGVWGDHIKRKVLNVSALEFAKRLLVYKVTLDFSPVSLRVLRTLSSGVSAFQFSELRVNLLCSYRLRGGSYKIYSRQVKVFRHLNVGSAIIS